MLDATYIDLDARSVISMDGYQSSLVVSFSPTFLGGKNC